jgi:hypothetical protein
MGTTCNRPCMELGSSPTQLPQAVALLGTTTQKGREQLSLGPDTGMAAMSI